jgi:hypothetical protein
MSPKNAMTGRIFLLLSFGVLIAVACFFYKFGIESEVDNLFYGAVSDRSDMPSISEVRYREIRELIKKNLHFSAHFVWAVDANTVSSVRARTSEEDIPVLIQMLGDKKGVIAVGARSVLESFGEKAIPMLLEAAKSTNPNISRGANEALIDLRNNPN